jgi:signal transduction histidine kinase
MPSALLELGDRYWALGLPAAARSALARALAADSDPAPALRLTDIALAQGDAQAARTYAAEAAKRAPGPATRILLGRAQVAAGELAAARMSLLAALDAPKLQPWDRIRAHLELARAAHAQGDAAGAGAQAGAAFEAALTTLAKATAVTAEELTVIEEVCAAIVAHGRSADATSMLAKKGSVTTTSTSTSTSSDEHVRPSAKKGSVTTTSTSTSSDEHVRPRETDMGSVTTTSTSPDEHVRSGEVEVVVTDPILAAALLAARHAAGDNAVSDRAIDAALAAIDPAVGGLAVVLRRLERRVRKHGNAERAALIAELDGLVRTSAGEALPAGDRARLWFLYGSLCADEASARAQAEDAYRKGLAFQPGHVGAACRLALLMLERGDQSGALAEIERALRIDASHGLAWRNAARMLDAQSPSLGVVVGRLLDAANPGAGSAAAGVAPRLVTATAEVARHDVLAGVYAHGHRVKNLLGIIGARTRSARKLAVEGDVHDRLKDLETDVTALYEEWAQYLRSMQAPTPTIELVPLSTLLHEIVVAAQARTQHVPITLEISAGLPDIRGDRMLLREALLNVVSNAGEACGATTPHGEVAVRARAVAAPGGSAAPIVEVVIADTGPGIPRAHLGRLFVPGFTTKETGSGVGLAIAERAVAAHHGRITVESEEGRGTTITITLPTDKTGLLQVIPLGPMGREERA